jgi:hypothetical protein
MRAALILTGIALSLPRIVCGQDVQTPAGPVIDTIIIERGNIFPPEQTEGSFVGKAGNAIHPVTSSWVIKSTILFKKGDTLDMSRILESERTLRALNVFQEVAIDTATMDGRLAVLIRTRDAWSLSPVFSIAGSGGSLTLTLGISEKNLLGTASALSIAYVKLVDRDGLDLNFRVPRFGSTRLEAGGSFQNLSAGNTGSWDAGIPYRAFPDPWAAQLFGNVADEQRFQFRRDAGVLDSTTYDHNLLSNRLTTSIAAQHSTSRFLRLGVDLLVRSEEYVLETNTLPVTDTLIGTVGLTLDYQESHFTTGRFFQGFGQNEDIDLSPAIHVKAWLAAKSLGYASTGIGPEITVSGGKQMGSTLLVGSVAANGLFSGAGLDSGRVIFRGTVARKMSDKQMMFVHVETGAMKNQPPGQEFDLGLTYGPRTFGAHGFVGTRTLWGTLEWRDYKWDSIMGFLGIGYALFFDYGGAWYEDQDPIWGGNVGAGLRLGSVIGSKASAARIDLGYRFGPGFEGQRFAVSFGGSYDIFTGGLTSLQ